MPQSLSFTLVHIIFSTKDRRPFITKDVIEDLHAYLSETSRNQGCECYRVGGVEDHVHLAVRLSRTITVAKLIEELKKTSSKWMKTKSAHLTGFTWQRGYGCFSLSPKDLDKLISYVDNQRKHHEKKTFQDEFREFLEAYGIDYDEKYVWD